MIQLFPHHFKPFEIDLCIFYSIYLDPFNALYKNIPEIEAYYLRILQKKIVLTKYVYEGIYSGFIFFQAKSRSNGACLKRR